MSEAGRYFLKKIKMNFQRLTNRLAMLIEQRQDFISSIERNYFAIDYCEYFPKYCAEYFKLNYSLKQFKELKDLMLDAETDEQIVEHIKTKVEEWTEILLGGSTIFEGGVFETQANALTNEELKSLIPIYKNFLNF